MTYETHAYCTCGWHKVAPGYMPRRTVPGHNGSHYRKREYQFAGGQYTPDSCPKCAAHHEALEVRSDG